MGKVWKMVSQHLGGDILAGIRTGTPVQEIPDQWERGRVSHLVHRL